jgi:hypothetical protein
MQPPEILASVSDGSVHVLSKSESNSIRGEFRTGRYYHGISQGCYREPSSDSLPSYESAMVTNGVEHLWFMSVAAASLGNI